MYFFTLHNRCARRTTHNTYSPQKNKSDPTFNSEQVASSGAAPTPSRPAALPAPAACSAPSSKTPRSRAGSSMSVAPVPYRSLPQPKVNCKAPLRIGPKQTAKLHFTLLFTARPHLDETQTQTPTTRSTSPEIKKIVCQRIVARKEARRVSVRSKAPKPTLLDILAAHVPGG